MIRVAVIGDSHFDEHSRFEECIRIHSWMADDMRKRGVTLVLHSGDVFERKSTPRERLAFAMWLQLVGTFAGVVVVRGNHDSVDDLQVFDRLYSENGIEVFEAPRVIERKGIAIAAMPWPRKADMLALVDAGEDTEAAAAEGLRSQLRELGEQLQDHPVPKILLMHAMVRGSVTSTGQPVIGGDLELGLEDLGLVGADFYALGHIHKGQCWKIGDAPCAYPGSPRRTAFGETEPKGYILAEFDESGLIGWERVETPATPMVLLEGRWHDGQLLGLEHEALNGAEVRLRWSVDSEDREAAKAAAREWRDRALAAGAVSVKLDEQVIATQRARVPELAQAARIEDKLGALWRARNDVPDEQRTQRLVGKVHELEEENHAL